MLELDQVDLGELADALQDHSPEISWWLNPITGEVNPTTDYDFADSTIEDEQPSTEDGWLPIDPLSSSAGYRDMETFITTTTDRHAADLLSRAIQGKGAFHRFKQTLSDFDELRAAWFRFSDARWRIRAIEWLLDHDLIEEHEADTAITALTAATATAAPATLPAMTGVRAGTQVFMLVAAALHTVSEISRRLDSDDSPIDALLLHLQDQTAALEQLAPTDESSPFTFSHLDRPTSWDFEAWFNQKAGGAADAARNAIRYIATNRDTMTVHHALDVCNTYLRVIHDQLIDDGLVIDHRTPQQ